MTTTTQQLQPYSAYKDSGVPWLGEVPEHWVTSNLRQVLRRVSTRNRPDLPLLSVVREKGVILRDTSSKEENHNFIPEDLSNYKVVQAGQFAMNKMKAWQGSYGVSQYDGLVSPAYFVFDVRGVDGNFFHAALRSIAYVPFFTGASDGVRIGQWDLSEGRMREIPFVIPPLPEQAAIVRFLDYVDRRIRRYIRAKGRLIALLEEEKQAIIHQAVTRGLDPAIGLKFSDISSINLPKGYRRTKLGRLCLSIRDGTHNPPPAVEGIHRLLSVRNIVNGRFVTRPDDRTMTAVAFAELQRSYSLKAGDVVLALVGGTTGKSAIIEHMENVSVQRSIGILRPNPSLIDSRYLNMLIKSIVVQKQIKQIMVKYAAQPGIYLSDVSNLQIFFPDIEIQREIIHLIEVETSSIDAAIESIRNQSALVAEYRTRLIADVVTGKLDVRAAAARLPEEIEEPGDEADTLDDETGLADAEDVDAMEEDA